MEEPRITSVSEDGASLRGNLSERAGMTELRRGTSLVVVAYFCLVGVCSAFWLMTISQLRIFFFPPDALYFFSSLPLSYWIGLSFCVLSILLVATTAKDGVAEFAKLPALLLLVLYLYGIPVFCYENPRFTDPYQHLAQSVFIMTHGSYSLPGIRYASAFPTAFVGFAEMMILLKTPALLFMKFFPLGVVLVLCLLTYSLAKSVGVKHPFLPTVFFAAINPFPIFHVSPQAFAFVPYVLFWMMLLRDGRGGMSPKSVAIAVILFLVILTSNPTTAVFTVGAVVFSVVVVSVFSRRRPDRRAWAFFGLFGLFIAVVSAAWFIWVAPWTLRYLSEFVGQALQELEEVGPSVTPATPDPTYATALFFSQNSVLVYWAFALISILVVLFSRIRLGRRGAWLVAWFISAWAFLSFAVHIQPTFMMRSFLYGLFPLSVIAAIILELRLREVNRRTLRHALMGLKVMALIMLVSAPVVLTVSRYSVDSFHYIPASALYAADFTAARSEGEVLILSPQAWEFRFYKALHGGAPDLWSSTIGSTYMSGVIISQGRAALHGSFLRRLGWADSVVFVDWTHNLCLVHDGSAELVHQEMQIEDLVRSRGNLVFSDSSVRVYHDSCDGCLS